MSSPAIALAMALAVPLGAQDLWGPGETEVLVSEIHYHPAENEDEEEFLELHNAGGRGVDLSGWRFTAGIELTIPDGTAIAPGGFLVVARRAAAIKAAHRIDNVIGDFKGNLSNTGETIELRNRAGTVVVWLCYGDGGRGQGFWPSASDGDGPSCELVEPNPDWHRSWWWRESRVVGGTPGRPSSRPEAWLGQATPRRAPAGDASVRINEVRLGGKDPFVELHNSGASTVKLEGLKVTRDPRQPGGIALTGAIARGKHSRLDGAALEALPGGSGKMLYLVESASGAMVDSFALRKDLAPELSLGRYPDGGNDIVSATRPSPGAANPRPPPPDLVINEILFHGPAAGAQAGVEEEFIEIFHRGKAPLSLKGWRLGGGVKFQFADDAVVPPGGFVVVSNQPARLRARVQASGAALVLGPFEGKLSNSGDTVELISPAGDRADRVAYSDKAPWPSGTDGGGFSLELVHADVDNRVFAAWSAGPPGGSPGRKNARASATVPPAIASVRHEPVLPAPEEEVVIRAHVASSPPPAEVAVIYRDVHSLGRPAKRSLVDTGHDADDAAKDGRFAGTLPKMRAGTLIGYHVQVRDAFGRTTRFPQGDGEIYVQAEAVPRTPPPPGLAYRVLCPQPLWDQFQRGGRMQAVEFPCTLVVSIDGGSRREALAYPGATVRYRGNSSRSPQDGRMSYRIELAPGDFFDGRDRIVINAFSSLRQKVGGDILRASGVAVSDVSVVRFKTPGFDDIRYVDVEVIKSEFLKRRYGSGNGGIYRGRGSGNAGAGRAGRADLSYHGDDPAYYLSSYDPINKGAEARIGAFIQALEALGTADDSAYAARVEAAIDADEWAAYFAVNHVVKNNENGLSKGVPDDYFIAQRPTDGKFILVAWDQDTIFAREMGHEPIFGPALPVVRKFLRHPRFAPRYQAAIQSVLDGAMASAGLGWRLQALAGRFPESDLGAIESFVDERRAGLQGKYPTWPHATLECGVPSAAGFGTRLYLSSELASRARLSGIADPALAFGVRALGEKASFNAITGVWTLDRPLVDLAAGANVVWVELLGPAGEVRAMHSIRLDKGTSGRVISGTLSGKVEWSAGSGPYVLEGATTVASGAELRIGPGADIVALAGSSLKVRGVLVIDGSPEAPVTFRPADASRVWGGVELARGSGGSSGHALKHCRFEGGDLEGMVPAAQSGLVKAQGTSLLLKDCLFRGIAAFAVTAEGGALKLENVRVVDGLNGVRARGAAVEIQGLEMARLRGDGLRLELAEPEAKLGGVVIRDVAGAALSLEGGKAVVDSALAVGCGAGLVVAGGAKCKARRVTLTGNRAGIEVDRLRLVAGPARLRKPAIAGPRSHVSLEESVLGPHVTHVASPAPGGVELSRCIVAPPGGGDAVKGEELLRATPVFRDVLRGDYGLDSKASGGGAGWGYAGRQ